MMTVEEFLSGKKPKELPCVSTNFIDSPLPDNWKDWYFNMVEEAICYSRDELKNRKVALNNIAVQYIDDRRSARYRLMIEQLAFVAGYLRTRGFNVIEYFSVFLESNPYNCICIEISW